MNPVNLTNNLIRRTALAILIILSGAAATFAQTAFTYQGRFTDTTAAQPTNGTYTMTFRLFDVETDGNQIPNSAAAITSMVSVVNSIFTVKLNFGAAAFNTIGARYLEIQVGNTILTPRQEITSTPFSQRALNAASADALSSACVGCVMSDQINSVAGTKITGSVANADNAGQLDGVTANNYVRTNSTAFIRNQTTQQTSTDFNVSGTGAANVFNAATQFNIGGSRVLSIAGTRNIFAGVSAGRVNTGEYNSFVGASAGFYNTNGSGNAFFGAGAGTSNTTGIANSYVGRDSGIGSTTGSSNSFFGAGAGLTNISGGNNTLLGALANVSSDNLNYATAVGAGAMVGSSNTIVLGRAADDVRVPGDLIVSGGISGSFGQSATTVLGTDGLTVARTNPNYVLVPGLRQTINVPANAVLLVSTDGGIETLSTTDDGISIVSVAIYVDGVITARRMYAMDNIGRITSAFDNWSLSRAYVLAAGSHTIEVRSRSQDIDGLSNAVVSGSSGISDRQGQLTVTIIKR